MSKKMKMFLFRPNEYGLTTYVVMAYNEEQARSFVHKHCEVKAVFSNYDPSGWGSIDYENDERPTFASGPMYQVEVYGVGEVTEIC